jgi:hypothetical protein
MKEEKNEKWLDKIISQAINTTKPQFDAEEWKQKYPEEFHLLKSRATRASTFRQRIWTAIFQSKIPKLAAAAVLLIVFGYGIAQLTAPRGLDTDQLHALEISLKSSLEPAIRQQLFQEMTQYWQAGLASSFARFEEGLQKQYRQDLTNFAIQTLAATNAVTNRRLEDLVNGINATQMEDRRWITAALEQMEYNRLQDKNQLATGLETLAIQTGDELMRTKQEMAQFLTYSQPDSIDVNKSDNLNNLDETDR